MDWIPQANGYAESPVILYRGSHQSVPTKSTTQIARTLRESTAPLRCCQSEGHHPCEIIITIARSAVPRRMLWEGWENLRIFSTLSTVRRPCGKGGKVYGPFPRFPQQAGMPLGEGWENLRTFSTLSPMREEYTEFTDTCLLTTKRELRQYDLSSFPK